MPLPEILGRPNQIALPPRPLYPNAYFKFDSSLTDSVFGKAATLTRATTAYLEDGTEIAANNPRYETGKYGKAIRVEEGTTNLLTENQSSVETDTTGFLALGSTIARDTTTSVHGSACLKTVTNNAGTNEGFQITEGTVAGTAGTTYAGGVRLKGSGTVNVWLRFQSAAHANLGETTRTLVTLTDVWQEAIIASAVAPATTAEIVLFARTPTKQAATFYTDCPQIEEDCATSWHLGGATRNAEVLTVPTDKVFEKHGWTTEFSVRPTSLQVVTGKTGLLWECYIDADNYYALKVAATGKPYLEVKSGGTTYTASFDSAMAVGTDYTIGIRGDGSTISLFVNGLKFAQVSYAEPLGALPANMYLGGDSSGANQANVLFSEVMFASRAKSDPEMTCDHGFNVPLGSL
jgi:hypothetical protein